MALRFRKITLPDGTTKLEKAPPTSEEVEEEKKLEEIRKLRREEYNKRKRREQIERDKKIKQESSEKYEEVLNERRRKQRENYQKRQNINPDHRKVLDDKRAIRMGYSNFNELRRSKKHLSGEQVAMDENKECSSYLGVHIIERKVAPVILNMIFEKVTLMPYSNPKFDALCSNAKEEFIKKYPNITLERNKDYKIQIKSSSLVQNINCSTSSLAFGIRRNNLADYFLLIAIGDREKLNLLHIWLIGKNDEVSYRKVTELINLKISNSRQGLYRVSKYELAKEFLDRANDVCTEIKNENNGMYVNQENEQNTNLFTNEGIKEYKSESIIEKVVSPKVEFKKKVFKILKK